MKVLPSGREISKDKAFNELFNDHWKAVHKLCLKYSQDSSVALDLSQNIFLSVWERKLQFSSTTDASSYLLKAARFQVLNHLRNKKDTIDISEEAALNQITTSETHSPEALLTYAETKFEISRQISNLKEPTKSIFLLSRENEMSYRQIADELNIGIKTVEKHISRALRQLRERLLIRS